MSLYTLLRIYQYPINPDHTCTCLFILVRNMAQPQLLGPSVLKTQELMFGQHAQIGSLRSIPHKMGLPKTLLNMLLHVDSFVEANYLG